eukprot:5998690-Pleurochrysis_carterae.AAC.1
MFCAVGGSCAHGGCSPSRALYGRLVSVAAPALGLGAAAAAVVAFVVVGLVGLVALADLVAFAFVVALAVGFDLAADGCLASGAGFFGRSLLLPFVSATCRGADLDWALEPLFGGSI